MDLFKLIFLAKQNLGLQTHRRGFSIEGLANQIVEFCAVQQVYFRIVPELTFLPNLIEVPTEIGILNPHLSGILIYYSEVRLHD